MAPSSITGLASGLDTAGIVNQLMQLEAAPQTRLRAQQSTQKSALTALQSLNKDLAALATRAKALASPAAWQTVAGSASTTDVTVSTTGAASPSSFSVTIDQLAVNHQLGFADAHALGDVVVGAAGLRITGHDGTVHDLATGGGTLQELVTAINSATADTGVTATAIRVADGSYRLLAQSTSTGAGSDFQLGQADGSPLLGGATVRPGADARISLGLGIVATSSSNTFTDLAPGVSLTLSAAATLGRSTEVTLARDPQTITADVQALVDQVNSLLSSLDTQTATSTSTSAAGVLSGDTAARGLRNALVDSVFGPGGTLASVGIQTDRYGKLVFDADTFRASYAADPVATAASFTKAAGTGGPDGWAGRLTALATAASDPVTGTLTTAITGRTSAIASLDDGIEAWDRRLELHRSSLTRQYTALETALSALQSQGSWLSNQLASLSSSSSA